MATILTKKKDTTGAPSAGDLTNSTGGAELAVNTADKRLYTKDSGGNVVEVGINPTSITTGTLNTSGAVVFNDAGADVDFRVESDTVENALFVDGATGNVGIGTSSPGSVLNFTVLTITGRSTDNGGLIRLETSDGTSGVMRMYMGGTSGAVEVSTADPLIFLTDSTERMRIDSSGNVGIGTSTITTGVSATETTLTLKGNSTGKAASFVAVNAAGSGSGFLGVAPDNNTYVFAKSNSNLIFGTNNLEKARIDSSGNLLVGKTATNFASAGVELRGVGAVDITRNANTALNINRLTNDGNLVEFYQAGTLEGSISVSGNTVSYNPFLGSHSGALADWSKPDIKIGTVMDTIDELLEYKVVVIDVQEEVPAKEAVMDEEGNEVEPAQEATTKTVQKRISYNGNGAVGSSATVEYEGQEYTGTIQHEREEPLSFNKHLKVKINDTAASKAVFGVFVGWNNDTNNDGGVYNDMLVGAVGNYVIRMAAGQEPQIGDLVEADGNGCAVVQDDDIIRTKTIAKVTSTIKQVTYDDGSFLVTCVLYCG